MTTLALDTPRAYELGDISEYEVIAAERVYEGAAVALNASGYAAPLSPASGYIFKGFAVKHADNHDGAEGAKTVQVYQKGKLELSVTGVAGVSDVGKAVYASDDDTFTLTKGSNLFIGTVDRYVSTGVAIVAFDATRANLNAGQLKEITFDFGGADSVTITKTIPDGAQVLDLQVVGGSTNLASTTNSCLPLMMRTNGTSLIVSLYAPLVGDDTLVARAVVINF